VAVRQRLLVLGTRDFSFEIAELAEDTGEFEVTAFVENLSRERCSETLEGRPIVWIDDVGELAADHLAVCGLGTTRRRIFAEQAAERGLRFATVVHPSARVPGSSTLGEGTIVSAGAVLGTRADLGRHVFVNRGALVGHHTEVGDYASLMPGSNVAGFCRIGEAAYVAIGAVVVDRTSVGAGSVVGAGAVVTKDVPERVQVVGVPAQVVKEEIDPR
jgi:sugar O-acyltransferase (sialic acid O-acetyltransferase NeuD family)